ncbi:hypothetical protein HS961_19710 [Comamonas piscis]|uniref:IPTL-CTERM sorting domain-containing protein n=1 Tax=Comamonas piscis TaxID=1562974 RepID=A0A7G5ELK9_9BURK|nr:hypothetical protein [Comamonas piscis]QMV74884.1 hypothetical protein HS961_19710 [Comamonas piscis]WSO33361.1 hypothetical protein VUJ63_19775 [Comamonas piscis]
MKFLFRTLTVGSVLISALLGAQAAGAGVVAAADVVPEATFQWGSSGPDRWGQVGLTAGGGVQVTTDFANSGNGSMRLDLPGTSAKAGLAYYPTATFGKLSELTQISYQWLVHTTDVVDQAPVLRLYLRNAAGQHTQTLVYTPDIAGVHGVGLNQWTTADMRNGIVWQGRSAAQGGLDPNQRRPFAEFREDPRFADLVVFAVEGGAGNGSSGFVGAIDNIEVVGPLASVSANFEVVPPMASIQCDQAQLLDSEGQVSLCTVSLSRPAEVALSILLTTTGDAGRYSGCAGPLEIAVGASTASCTITATPNTVKGDGQVSVSVAIAPAANADDYSLQAGASVAAIEVTNDDGALAAPAVLPPAVAVPVLSGGMLALLSLGLLAWAAFVTRRIRGA